jgi:hypothetical protein
LNHQNGGNRAQGVRLRGFFSDFDVIFNAINKGDISAIGKDIIPAGAVECPLVSISKNHPFSFSTRFRLPMKRRQGGGTSG